MALVALRYSNGCWTDGRYNHSNYRVEFGKAVRSDGATRHVAFRIHPPATLASSFLASRHAIHYRFATQEDHCIYALSAGRIQLLAEVAAAEIDPAQSRNLGLADISELAAPLTLIIAPATERVSNFSLLGNGVEGARIHTSQVADVLSIRYPVGQSPADTVDGFPNGPSTHANIYSNRRIFFPVQRADGQVGNVLAGPVSLGSWLRGEAAAKVVELLVFKLP